MFVFNVLKQIKRLNHGVVDITVEMQFSENVAANTKAYALVINDRILKLQIAGKKMNVLYYYLDIILNQFIYKTVVMEEHLQK